MGGLFSSPTPVAPVQSNEAQLYTLQQSQAQSDLLYQQQLMSMQQQQEADAAQTEQQRLVAIRESEAEIAKKEREDRIKKGKKDLLYKTALGVNDEEDALGAGLLKLGGDV